MNNKHKLEIDYSILNVNKRCKKKISNVHDLVKDNEYDCSILSSLQNNIVQENEEENEENEENTNERVADYIAADSLLQLASISNKRNKNNDEYEFSSNLEYIEKIIYPDSIMEHDIKKNSVKLLSHIDKIKKAIDEKKIILNSTFSRYKTVIIHKSIIDIDDMFLHIKIKCHTSSKYLKSGIIGIIVILAILKKYDINIFEMYNLIINISDIDIHKYEETKILREIILQKNPIDIKNFDNFLVEDKFMKLKKRVILFLSTILKNKELCNTLTILYGPQRQANFITNLLIIIGAHIIHPECNFSTGSGKNNVMKLIQIILHNTIFHIYRRNIKITD